jgi:hypothetical protein
MWGNLMVELKGKMMADDSGWKTAVLKGCLKVAYSAQVSVVPKVE